MESISYFEKLHVISKKEPQCIKGLIRTLLSMVNLSKEVLEEPNIDHLALGRICQDPLENFFGTLRTKLGNNTNPSVRESQYLNARLLSMKISSQNLLENKNCIDDIEEDSLDWNFKPVPLLSEHDIASKNLRPQPVNPSQEPNLSSFNRNDDAKEFFAENLVGDLRLEYGEEEEDANVAQKAATRYFAGYALNTVLLKKLNCEKCLTNLRSLKCSSFVSSEAFIAAKNFKNTNSELLLCNPSDEFMNVCSKHFDIFKRIYDEKCHRSGIFASIIKECKRMTPEWFKNVDECYHHKIAILEHLIRVLLRKHCKWTLENIVCSKRKAEKSRKRHEPAAKKLRNM